MKIRKWRSEFFDFIFNQKFISMYRLVFHQDQEIQEIMCHLDFESSVLNQDHNKKLEIDFKTRIDLVIKIKIF